ncbi:sensor histidine kinase [Clostridium tarantellae]|uniref:histidine kinase n=1 Tax=Clostridium tarantellae TaxID=39493 RepID=A0A6I1ML68_9CLOT|nr:HAMP domain-containing sensor histidine kinase [Clostridium tarantellae]MPQ43760.1 sensor histidine kinase [Clostridium tarantellae]
MAIKLTNNFKRWWNDYRIWVRDIENVFIFLFALLLPMLFLTLTGGSSFKTLVKLNYKSNSEISNRVRYIDAIIDPDRYKQSRLLEQSTQLSDFLYDSTDYLKDVENCTTKEQKEKILSKLQEYATFATAVVVVNNKTGDYYSNRVFFHQPPYTLSTPKEVVESMAKNNGVVYKIIKSTDNIDEIYFSPGNYYDRDIKYIRIAFATTCITTILLIILLIKKIFMIKKMKLSGYLKNLKAGYIYNFIICFKLLFSRRILIDEFLKDKVLFFLLAFVLVYTLFRNMIIKIDFMWNATYYYIKPEEYIVIAIILLVIHFICKFIKKYDSIDKIIEDLNHIKKGNVELEVTDSEDKQVRELAKGINDLRIGYRNSIEEGIKNEKLKTELISNVSHDLKTPLTSIINYVNILQRDDVTESEKKEYVSILESKSYRLKKLIDDLFEVSKMNSGKVQLFEMDIDIIQLVYQCISEVEDFYSEKNMQFKVRAPEELIVKLDPQRMSRVFQNLATNALKYGLENTRIYVDIKEMRDFISVSFKNISTFELDFNEEDILERFVRGDKSRNSTIEGSGLGLAIAKTIVELHHGIFRVECEGDLFKAFVTLPKNNIKNQTE